MWYNIIAVQKIEIRRCEMSRYSENSFDITNMSFLNILTIIAIKPQYGVYAHRAIPHIDFNYSSNSHFTNS